MLRFLMNNKWIILSILPCLAFANGKNDLSFAGFVSQGISYTSDNQFFDAEDNTSFNMTTLALQANYLFNDQIRLSGQALYRNWGKIESSRIDFLMADYQFINQQNYNIGFRLGRIKSDLGVFNSTRDIPSARPSIFLPQSVYQDTLRDTTTSYDGLSLYGNQVFDLGRLNWTLAYGRYPVSSDLSESILGKELGGEISTKNNTQIHSTWESVAGNWSVSLGYENPQAFAKPLFDINDPIAMEAGDIKFDRYIFSHQYFSALWDLTFEFIYQDTEIKGFELFIPYLPSFIQQPVFPEITTDSLVNVGFYAQWRYFLNEDLTLMLRYGKYFTDIDDKDGSQYQQDTGMPDFSRYSFDFSTGVKWKLSSRWQINFEGHFFEGTAAISPTIKLDHSDNDEKYWQLWSLQVSYSF
ncbi:hypothetical protein CXF85_01380 [Colwellia sp. 75C3]|uniref:hypothetical protein n=1 Tax=Colwellia sp. 75C3 TaxID=888425 RepID=UPI000C34AFAD|nr:hypothetical protein [Colwellia sp. 75C3]PKG86382.1 hypothetical protein CXF85_01380 [Colwellia sp. 75C3]